jgi:hypothetical protein
MLPGLYFETAGDLRVGAKLLDEVFPDPAHFDVSAVFDDLHADADADLEPDNDLAAHSGDDFAARSAVDREVDLHGACAGRALYLLADQHNVRAPHLLAEGEVICHSYDVLLSSSHTSPSL